MQLTVLKVLALWQLGKCLLGVGEWQWCPEEGSTQGSHGQYSVVGELKFA